MKFVLLFDLSALFFAITRIYVCKNVHVWASKVHQTPNLKFI